MVSNDGRDSSPPQADGDKMLAGLLMDYFTEEAEREAEESFRIAPFDPHAFASPDSRRADGAVSPRPWRRWLAPLALAASIALGVGLFYSLTPGDPTLVPKGGGDPSTAVAADTLHLGVLRDGVVFRAEPDQKLRSGDIVRFFHSSREAGFVAVFHLEATGRPTALFPTEGGAMAAIDAGSEAPLEGGAKVVPGSGCQWVVAVFADEALPLDRVRADLDLSRRVQTPGCELTLAVPGARAIASIPLRQ